MNTQIKENGFTLLEVLVAVLVFSFGLLGIAGMMTISVKSNHNGYLRSQASFLAENMMDRMRANPTALWNGWYTGAAAQGALNCNVGNPCNYQSLAAYDMQAWADSLTVTLPSGQGTINCVPNSGLPASIVSALAPSIWFPAPPYDGVCTVTITWNESNRNSAADQQTMTLVGQP